MRRRGRAAVGLMCPCFQVLRILHLEEIGKKILKYTKSCEIARPRYYAGL
jgi:hypothetical protein